VTTPKLEVLCSCTYRPHLEEPFHMNILPAPKGPGVQEIFRIIKYWREEHERRRKASTRREGRRKNGVSVIYFVRGVPLMLVSQRGRGLPA
jgi:hypothetical protein